MKLFVDDLRNPPDDSWTVVRTVTEAIRLLDTQDITEVSLDHDISHGVYANNGQWVGAKEFCPETYEPVARFIANSSFYSAQHNTFPITIHTGNPVGGKKLLAILNDFKNVTIAPSKIQGR